MESPHTFMVRTQCIDVFFRCLLKSTNRKLAIVDQSGWQVYDIGRFMKDATADHIPKGIMEGMDPAGSRFYVPTVRKSSSPSLEQKEKGDEKNPEDIHAAPLSGTYTHTRFVSGTASH